MCVLVLLKQINDTNIWYLGCIHCLCFFVTTAPLVLFILIVIRKRRISRGKNLKQNYKQISFKQSSIVSNSKLRGKISSRFEAKDAIPNKVLVCLSDDRGLRWWNTHFHRVNEVHDRSNVCFEKESLSFWWNMSDEQFLQSPIAFNIEEAFFILVSCSKVILKIHSIVLHFSRHVKKTGQAWYVAE